MLQLSIYNKSKYQPKSQSFTHGPSTEASPLPYFRCPSPIPLNLRSLYFQGRENHKFYQLIRKGYNAINNQYFIEMSERKSGKQPNRKKRTQVPSHAYWTAPASTTWRCSICKESIDNSESFCFQCYQSLYYYSYINMHLFVESDHSFKDIYFPNPFLPHRALQVSSEASTDSEEDNDSLDLNWVENILTGE